jgi:zinc transport system substrate-binding protein
VNPACAVPADAHSYGEYSKDKYEVEMKRNLDTVVRAIQENRA